MKQLFKLSHHSHSGKHRPHEHTSYPLLFFILSITTVTMALYTYSAYANQHETQSESVSLTGAMPGPPPEEPAVITSPDDQDRFDTSPITVSGTCPEESLVEILKSNIFAGSVLCSGDGTFSVDIDLLIGENELVARVYNPLNQPGPNSEIVTVFYDALPPQESPLSPLEFGSSQLLLSTNAVYRGTFPNDTFTLPVEIIGGTAPFALDVNWGDNSSTMVPRENNQPFNVDHVYERAGTYRISMQATDSEGRVAFLNVVSIINGQPSEISGAGVGSTGSGFPFSNYLHILWPILVATLGMVLSFWMGEIREKRILASRGLLLHDRV